MKSNIREIHLKFKLLFSNLTVSLKLSLIVNQVSCTKDARLSEMRVYPAI